MLTEPAQGSPAPQLRAALLTTDTAVRAALVVAASAAAAAGGPTWLRTALVLLAAAAVAQRVVLASRDDRVRALAGVVGGGLVLLVLLGLGMDALHVPLGRVAWAVVGGLVGLAVLATAARAGERAGEPGARTPLSGARRPGWLDVAAGAVAVAVVAASLVVAVRSTRGVDDAPLSLALSDVTSSSAVVTVSSSQAAGPYQLRVTGDAVGTTATYAVPALALDGSTPVRVGLPTTGRAVVDLVNPGQTEPLRAVVVDR